MSIRPLSPDLQKKAEDELNENPQRRNEDIQYIKNWLAKQPHLIVNADDQLILNFLRGCKFSYEKTKEKIDNYYTTRTLLPEYFNNRDPLSPEINNNLKLGRFWLPLPQSKDPLIPTIFYLSDYGNPTQEMDYGLAIKISQMLLDIVLHEDDSFNVNGFHLIVRLNKLSKDRIMHLTPTILKNLYMCVSTRYPSRLKGVHILNVSPALLVICNILKGFMSKKVQSRVYFYDSSNFTELHKLIPKSSLPMELGGENDYNINDILEEWKKKIETYRDWFLEDEKYRSDECKRIGKPNKYTEFFEIEGSFRKLDVD